MNTEDVYMAFGWVLVVAIVGLVLFLGAYGTEAFQCWKLGETIEHKVERMQCKVLIDGRYVPYERWRAI